MTRIPESLNVIARAIHALSLEIAFDQAAGVLTATFQHAGREEKVTLTGIPANPCEQLPPCVDYSTLLGCLQTRGYITADEYDRIAAIVQGVAVRYWTVLEDAGQVQAFIASPDGATLLAYGEQSRMPGDDEVMTHRKAFALYIRRSSGIRSAAA